MKYFLQKWQADAIARWWRGMLVAVTLLVSGGAGAAVAAAGDQIGTIEFVTGTVTISRADGAQVDGVVALDLFQNDVVTSGAESTVGISFVDGTSLGLGANAQMTLDDYAFDPQAVEGGGILSIAQGSFAFVSGGLGKVGDDALKVTGPTLTAGIRGTQVAGAMAGEGVASHIFLMREQDGSLGKLFVANAAGLGYLLDQENQGVRGTSASSNPDRPFIADEGMIMAIAGDALFAMAQAQRRQNNAGPEDSPDQAMDGEDLDDAAEFDDLDAPLDLPPMDEDAGQLGARPNAATQGTQQDEFGTQGPVVQPTIIEQIQQGVEFGPNGAIPQ